MGYATTICSDKAGTLTSNQMAVVEAYACLKKVNNSDGKARLVTNGIIFDYRGHRADYNWQMFMCLRIQHEEGSRHHEAYLFFLFFSSILALDCKIVVLFTFFFFSFFC